MLGLIKDYLLGLFALAMAVTAGTQLGDAPVSVLAANTFIYMIMILGCLWAVPVLIRSIARAINASPEGQQPVAAYSYLAIILGAVALMIILRAPVPSLEEANANIGLPAALSLLAICYLVSLPKFGQLMAPVTFGRRSPESHDSVAAAPE